MKILYSVFLYSRTRNIFVFWCYYVQTLLFRAEIVGMIFVYVLQMCSKVLQPSSLVVVFETLLSSAATTVDDEKGNPSWQACADFYITCILSCLPWGGAELMEVMLFRCCIYNLLILCVICQFLLMKVMIIKMDSFSALFPQSLDISFNMFLNNILNLEISNLGISYFCFSYLVVMTFMGIHFYVTTMN